MTNQAVAPMHRVPPLEELRLATSRVTTTLDSVPEPLPVRDAYALRPRELRALVARYERHGFAVAELERDRPEPATLVALASSLGLGEPFLPPLYRVTGSTPSPISRISAALNAANSEASHPSFGRTVGQALHCDGTLQPIAYVKASMLLCESPAADGGETMIFNAAAAYAELVRADPQAAVALATPGVLVRRATVNGSQDVNVGPAFAVQDGELACGYSTSDTDSWAVPDGVPQAVVARGVEFLAEAARRGSPHYLEFTLQSGQVIVSDNTTISHGRTPYRDSDTRRRCLYRSLHLEHPRAG